MKKIKIDTKYLNILSLGEKIRVNHSSDDCGGSSASMIIERHKDGVSAYCFRCSGKGWLPANPLKSKTPVPNQKVGGFSLPIDICYNFPLQAAKKINMLSKEELTGRVWYSPSLRRLVFPVWGDTGLEAYLTKKVFDDDPYPKNVLKKQYGSSLLLYHIEKSKDKVIIVEDIISAIVAARYISSISLLGTSINNRVIEACIKYKKVFIAFDNDNPIVRKKQFQAWKQVSQFVPDCVLLKLETDFKHLTEAAIRSTLGILEE